MPVVTLLAIYFVVWWISLFSVLPFGIRMSEDKGEGHMNGAPEKPPLKRIFLINSGVAAVITLILWSAIEFGGLSVRSIAGQS